MRKSRRSRSRKIGLPPGTLVHVGEIKVASTSVTTFQYDSDSISENKYSPDTLPDVGPPDHGTLWLNVHGLHDASLMGSIGRAFGLHPLVMEDILHTEQRPKLDSYGEYIYIVARVFAYDKASMACNSEQISLVLGPNFVLTFQERPTGSFDPIRERLRAAQSHLRKSGADYLAYSLLDMVVDRYFGVLEQIGDACEVLEEELLRKPTSSMLQQIHKLKRETMELRRSVWPLREVLNSLVRNDAHFFRQETVIYLRDVYDHTVHFIESMEGLRDLLSGMLDIYLSSISNRVNMEVRALTVVAMLFMPATLIAGIFGMNFKSMPWLREPDGFWIAIGLMVGIGSIMGMIFWRRQWLSKSAG